MKALTLKTIVCIVILLFFSCGGDDNEPAQTLEPELTIADLNVAVMENADDMDILGRFAVIQENLTAPLVFEVIAEEPSGAVTVNGDGQLLVANSTAFDFEARQVITGEVEVSSGALSQTASFTINILDVDELELSVVDLVVEVAENPENGSVLGQLEVIQANLTDPLEFEVVEVEPSGAVIVDGAGQLLVANAAAFDFEIRQVITGVVEVSSGTLSQSASFTINILDIDEPAVPFITLWNLTPSELTVVLPLYSGSPEDMTAYDFSVNWGDGSEIVMVTSFDDPDAIHTYANAGPKTVTITGTLKGFNFGLNGASRDLIVDVMQWGDMNLGNAGFCFNFCSNLTGFTASDSPILLDVTNLSSTFQRATSFNGNLSSWDVSNVTNMEGMFFGASSFNGDLSSWDVSNVVTMALMFHQASSFNGDISNWDVSNVENMNRMFFEASAFNGDISNWDVSNVNIILEMFSHATSFNSDLASWDVSNVENMFRMFRGASSFNRDLSSWNVSNVQNMSGMFFEATSFDGDLSSWDVSNVREMNDMFGEATSFNSAISSWDVSSVEHMTGMFDGAISFNGDISSWDVSSVDSMFRMFQRASSFNANISGWDVSNVATMSFMFNGANSFNRDLSSWDVSNVIQMEAMFKELGSFNQDLSSWNVSKVRGMREMFRGASTFNSDISSWDVSSVEIMTSMFQGASSFSQNLSNWATENVVICTDFSEGSGLTLEQLPTAGPCF